jgi:hypothetical protein
MKERGGGVCGYRRGVRLLVVLRRVPPDLRDWVAFPRAFVVSALERRLTSLPWARL